MLIEVGLLSHCLTPQQRLSLSSIKPIINDINPYISADDHKHAQWKALQFMAPHSSHEELAGCGIFYKQEQSVFMYLFFANTIFILG